MTFLVHPLIVTSSQAIKTIDKYNDPLDMPSSPSSCDGYSFFASNAAMLPKTRIDPFATAWQSVVKSPHFVWADASETPGVTVGVLAGLCGLSLAGTMDVVGPWIFALGSVTAAWLTLRGAVGLQGAAKAGDKEKAFAHARDFGIGVFSISTMLASAALVEGLHHLNLIPESSEDLGHFLKALTAILHSSDEIAMGAIIAGKLVRSKGG